MDVLRAFLVVVHVGATAAWLGGMLYSITVVQPKLERFFADPSEREDFATVLAAGARWKVLGLAAVLALSGRRADRDRAQQGRKHQRRVGGPPRPEVRPAGSRGCALRLRVVASVAAAAARPHVRLGRPHADPDPFSLDRRRLDDADRSGIRRRRCRGSRALTGGTQTWASTRSSGRGTRATSSASTSKRA